MNNQIKAQDEYKKLDEEANELISRLKQQLYIAGKNSDKNTINWGHVASLTDFNKTLRSALFQIGGTTEEENEKYKF